MPTTHYGTFPILLPGTTRTISRNGLQRTSGTILCKPDDEPDAISLAETFGSVFPDVSTRTNETGLVEVSFDAYEAVGASTTRRGTLAVTLSKTFSGTYTTAGNSTAETAWTITELWLVDTLTTFTTVLATASSSAISGTTTALSRSFKKRTVLGRVGSGGPYGLSLTWATVISDLNRRNFGDIDEVDITYSQTATIA
jgi:hypothetical protein